MNAPCGLHIVGTERHEARRIDNQLRGRAGRQGDPGSSRFFLSLEDDLLKLFMPDWMLKMMERLGFVEGASLEDKRISKGIERAQRKVEERNFATRKHLLEWDEPMDYQRRAFYAERQRILEGRKLDDLIWRMIDESVAEAVGEFLAEDYVAKRISDWCRTTLDLSIEPGALMETDAEYLANRIRGKAKDEIRDMVRTTLGEYIDEEEPPESWDVGGLLKWAQRLFRVPLTQNQMRKMTPAEIEERLYEAADAYYDKLDLSPIQVYLDPLYGRAALAEWVRNKFLVDLKTDDIAEGNQEQVTAIITEKVRQTYAERELRYPVEAVMSRAFSTAGADSVYALQQIVDWVNAKYQAGWTTDRLEGKPPERIAEELVAVTRRYVREGGLEQEVDEARERFGRRASEELVDWAVKRFGQALDIEALKDPDRDVREVLVDAGRQMARWELTQLERYVLLRIYDQGWKDHLLEMDHLKFAIMQRPMGGDQTHPQSQYAIEGRDLFNQMWRTIRSRVTDLIFKVGAGGDGETEARPVVSRMELRHEEATNLGFAGTDQEAAMRAQGEATRTATIRRAEPKVGRNDPCPCGSGKKYKHCHGKGR